MFRTMMKSKIHRATVTHADLHYVGSVTVDQDLMDAADLLEGEQVCIVDIDNGNRLETYVIAGERGSGIIGINGAAARLVSPGDLVILSGFMRLFPPRVVDALSPQMINTHPAFLPEFPGAHGVRDALKAGVTQTGASVIVVDNGVDTGPIIARERVPVLPGDTEAGLHERIKIVERRLLIQAVLDIANGHIDLKELATA